MTPPASSLAHRQQALLLRSSELRQAFAREAAVLQPPLALADQARAAWLWLRAHPEVPLAAALVLAVLRPRRAWRLGWRLWSGWQLWRRLQQPAQPLVARGALGLLGTLGTLVARRFQRP